MTSEESLQQLLPNPVQPPPPPSMADMMSLQAQQAQERADLNSRQRVAGAILQATQSQAAPSWRGGRRGGRLAVAPSPAAGLAGLGSQVARTIGTFQHQQQQDAMRDQQRRVMMGMMGVLPVSATTASDPNEIFYSNGE